MAAQRSGRKSSRRKGRRRGFLLPLLVILLPVSAMFMPTALLLAVGLIPTLVAYIIDRDPHKTAAMTVGAMNFTGIMAYALDLWRYGHTMGAVTKVLSQPMSWLVMYGAAAVGWVLYFAIPPLVGGWVTMRAKRNIEKQIESQRALVEEWGPEIEADPDAPPESPAVSR